MVRHPFQFVVSAYTDKLESYSRDLKYRGGYYYAMYGADIVKKLILKYQEKLPKNPMFLRKEPSFVEFVEYPSMTNTGSPSSCFALLVTSASTSSSKWKLLRDKKILLKKNYSIYRDTNFILSQRDLTDVISLSKKTLVGDKFRKK